MTKHCGLGRVFAFLVAGLFCLTLTAPSSQADTLHLGPGAQDDCYAGGCQVWDKDGTGELEVNLILTESVSVHYQGENGTPELSNPVLFFFLVPVQNLLFPFDIGPALNPDLTSDSVDGAKLYDLSAGLPLASPPNPSEYDVDVDFPGSPAYLSGFSQGDIFDTGVFFHPTQTSFTGLPGNASTSFDSLQTAEFEIPETLANDGTLSGLLALLGLSAQEFIDTLLQPNEITGFKIWVFELETGSFGKGDTIHIDTSNIPLGTFVSAWGHHCSPTALSNGCAASPPLTEIAIMMPLPECLPGTPECNPPGVPEPTSLLLLGTGLLGIGRQWRKRQNQKKAEKQNVG